MRNLFQKRFLIISLMTITACKKNEISLTPLASLNVVNAVIGGGDVKLNDNVQDSAKAFNSKTFGIIAGTNNLSIYSTNNPSKPYYNNTLETENGGNYSIFLSGQSTGIEALFIQENIPPSYADSIIGIRVVNLSPNSTSLNITLASAPNNNFIGGLAYKQMTDFIQLPLRSLITTGSMSFQVRNGGNNLLATYTLPTVVNSTYPGISVQLSRFKNISLVVKGLIGTNSGNDAFGIFPVANY